MAVPRLGAGTSPWGQSIGSRNSLDDTRRFPELVNAVAALDAPSLILDGEIANLFRQLISDFEWLRARPKGEVSTPPRFLSGPLLLDTPLIRVDRGRTAIVSVRCAATATIPCI